MTASGDRQASQPLELIPARNGEMTARLAGVYLHSHVDPSREAARHAAAHVSTPVETLILFGPGLGYIAPAVRELEPKRDRRIVSVFLHAATFDHAIDRGDAAWCPGSGVDLQDFLRRQIRPQDIPAVGVVMWPPVAKALRATQAGPLVSSLEKTLLSTIEELRRDLVTAAFFSQRRLRNAVRNVFSNHIRSLVAATPLESPTLVVASGPSLEGLEEAVHRASKGALVVATASALPYLAHARVSPDVVVHIDAGYYARLHLHRAPPPSLVENRPVLMPFTAAGTRGLIVPISFGAAEERILGLAGETSCATPFPEAATVSATACRIAQFLATGPHYCLGFDFAALDLLDHARPHAFDRYLEPRSWRLEPVETNRFLRVSDHTFVGESLRQSAALAYYADWFARNTSLFPRFFRVRPSLVAIGMPTADVHEMIQVCSRGPKTASVLDRTVDRTEQTRTNLRRRIDELDHEWQRCRSTDDFIVHPLLGPLCDLVDFANARRVKTGSGDVGHLREGVSRILRRLVDYARA